MQRENRHVVIFSFFYRDETSVFRQLRRLVGRSTVIGSFYPFCYKIGMRVTGAVNAAFFSTYFRSGIVDYRSNEESNKYPLKFDEEKFFFFFIYPRKHPRLSR